MSPSESHRLLSAYLDEKDAYWSAQLVEQLIEKSTPLIEKIVVGNLRNLLGSRTHFLQLQDLPDVRQEIILRLLTQLKVWREKASPVVIKDFPAYIATVSYNCCYEYKQRKYPQRFRLKKKLQYLFTHQLELGLWQDDAQEWFGGLREWGGDLRHWQILVPQRAEQLLNNQLPKVLQNVPDASLRRNSALEQVVALFNWSQEFIHLGDLIAIFQKWWNLPDETVQLEDYFLTQPFEVLKIETALESNKKLKTVWAEITLLPLAQRKALLLNLRDSVDRELVTLLPALDIASLREIAASLEMIPENLAQVWNNLPLNDQQIASEMGLERRQVINLRRAARERLARRLNLN